MERRIKICSISAYASLGSKLNLSALSIMLKELHRIENSFDNTRVRRRHDTIEAMTCVRRTFFNSISFPLRFRTNNNNNNSININSNSDALEYELSERSQDSKISNIHVRIFTTGTVHVTGASEYDVIEKAFLLILGLVMSCHCGDKEYITIMDTKNYGIHNKRIAMLHALYIHSTAINREQLADKLLRVGRNVRYDAKLHNAVNVRFTSIDGAFLIFSSGKMLVTGCKDIDTCESELELLLLQS